MRASPALNAALALARAPALASVMRAQPVPAGTQDLLRVLAGEGDALARAKIAARLRSDAVFSAIELYVQQVLLHPDSDCFRVLGLQPDTERAVARVHMRLLLIWLHPDKSDSAWRSSFSHRVIAAWKEIPADGRAITGDRAVGRAQSPSGALRGAPRGGLLPWVRLPHPAPPAFPDQRRRRSLHVTFASAVMLLASTGPAESWNVGAVSLLPGEARYEC